MLPYHFQSYHRGYQGTNEKYPCERCRFVKDENAEDDGKHRPDPRPYRISRTYRKCLRGFGQKEHAYYQADYESCSP